MTLLIIGLLVFTGTHFALSLFPTSVARFRDRRGEKALSGLVALLSLAGLVLLVLGWRGSEIEWVYAPNPALRYPGMLLIALGIYLFIVSNRPSRVKRWLRHPQLTGLLMWSTGHLLLNGEARALVLFGGLAVWAALEIPLINRRDTAWEKPSAPGAATDLATALVALAAILALVWAHPWLAGVSLIPA